PEDKTRRKAEIMELQRSIAWEQAAYLAEQFDAAAPDSSGVQFDVLIDKRLNAEAAEGAQSAQSLNGGSGAASSPEGSDSRAGGNAPGRGHAATSDPEGVAVPRGMAARPRHIAQGRCYFQAPEVDAITLVES